MTWAGASSQLATSQTSTGSTTVSAITYGSNSNLVITNPYLNPIKRPRKKRKPRQVPDFTSTIEARLIKHLGKDARRLLRSMTKKYNPPTVTQVGVNTEHKFRYTITYYDVPVSMVVVPATPGTTPFAPQRITKTFTARLTTDIDLNLVDFSFSVRAGL